MRLSRREVLVWPALGFAAHHANASQGAGTRDIVLKAFREERPPATAKVIPRSAPTKRNSQGPPIVGVTLWRMRRSIDSDPVKIRGLVHDPGTSDNDQDWTPERVSLQEPLSEKNFVRLSIESARRGYLYVLNRDVYPGEVMSDPMLIFPTLRLRGGNNYVEPGITIEIPEARDKPPVFRIKKTRQDQVSVMLIMMVVPQPLADVRVPPEAVTIPEQPSSRLGSEVGFACGARGQYRFNRHALHRSGASSRAGKTNSVTPE